MNEQEWIVQWSFMRENNVLILFTERRLFGPFAYHIRLNQDVQDLISEFVRNDAAGCTCGVKYSHRQVPAVSESLRFRGRNRIASVDYIRKTIISKAKLKRFNL